LRPGDTAARLGGDEFAILLEETKNAETVANRISDALAEPFVLHAKEVFITASVGISVSEVGQGGANELLRNADAAMYAAKSRGKGRSVMFQPDMHVRALQRLDLEAELRRAIEREEFRLHYQPLVEVESGRITGLEALLRWAHPERGLLGPNEFISIAEDTGLIRPIGRWVLHQAAHQAREWQVRYNNQRLNMSVNLSAPELAARELVTDLRRVLAESGLDPSTLVLEMTERVLMSDTEAAMARLQLLRNLGVRLSVDDFGTGFSSLSYLHSFPIDGLKIAKTFLDRIPEGHQETALVRGIIELGRNLDLEIVGEGVERVEQWHALRDMGCDVVQGYLFARPQGPERIDALLGNVTSVAGSAPARDYHLLSSYGLFGNLGPATA
jgi:predicted signal transduction protein with EAL and GGDEF domain